MKGWRRRVSGWAWLAACGLLVLLTTDADARGPGRGRSAGRAPHVAAPRQNFRAPAYKPPRMPRAATPARSNQARPRTNAKAATPVAPRGAQTHANSARTPTTAPRGSSAVPTTRPSARGSTAGVYTYGTGAGARRYRAYGYGRGYRNGYYGRRYGYGRSQANNRMIVARLRSVHAGLARLDRTYQGHRVRAMHAISMAIRQLSHRSMIYRGVGFSPRGNFGMGTGAGRGQGNLGAGLRRRQPMSQAQSDARMGQALRSLQGISTQLGNQVYHTGGHARARGHVQRAIRELGTALAIR
jgi:hypothetical protein